MNNYRSQLPQLTNRLLLTDGGLETTLVFHEGVDLPHFASFELLNDHSGKQRLLAYYRRYLELAAEQRLGFILESPTWRANFDWGAKLGYTRERLHAVNLVAIDLMVELRREFERRIDPIVISGNLGPRGDGYRVDRRMSASEAAAYHMPQVKSFADSAADMIAGFTLNYVDEGIGMVTAATAVGMPIAISFTVETDGRLPSGESLREAIERTDAATGNAPAYYMINCAHPNHFGSVLDPDSHWTRRIRGIRANASTLSHAELDNCAELDIGDIEDLGQQHRSLLSRMNWISVIGGCCGTDHRHVSAICRAAFHR
jgi:homocysteine S-methyltransferase